MNKKHIVLFDMDGTLTEPRSPFQKELLPYLLELSEHAEIGILTGADYSDVKFQLLETLRYSEVRFKTHLLPCNGTKHYRPPDWINDFWNLVFENDMRKELGSRTLNGIFKILAQQQADACYYDIPLTGQFINYRGSMINWCPMGRNANKQQRRKFVEYDKENDFRLRLCGNLKHRIELSYPKKVAVKLGGETSFDVYPAGWNKTYALRHFENNTCWFVGDATHVGGNDHEIYELLAKENRAFTTSGPKHTEEIIDKIILSIKAETNAD